MPGFFVLAGTALSNFAEACLLGVSVYLAVQSWEAVKWRRRTGAILSVSPAPLMDFFKGGESLLIYFASAEHSNL